MKKIGDLSLLIVAIIWGGGFIGVQKALDYGFGSFTIIFYRFLIAFLIISAMFWKKFLKIDRAHLIKGTVLGVFLFLGFILQTVGLEYTTPSKNAFITSLYVVMVPFLYWIINRKKPQINVFVASLFSIMGMYLLSTGSIKGLNIGDWYTFLCAIFFALHMVLLSYYGEDKDPIKLTIIQMGVSTVLAGFFIGIEKQPDLNGLDKFYPIIYLGIFSTMLAFLLQTMAQKYTTSTRASIILSLEASFGALFSVLFFREVIGLKMFFGFLLFLSSVLMVELKIVEEAEVNG